MDQLLVESSGSVTTLTLNHPEKRNALSLGLMRAAIDALSSLASPTRVVVIAGRGPVFSAGHDLDELIGAKPSFHAQVFDTCTELMALIHAVPQPVIARVHGTATAAGCQLVAACDLAVAADTATFATPGVKIGLFCSTPMVPLVRAIGRKRALEMLLTGEPIDAATALDWGLLNRVVALDAVDDAIEGLVAQITRFSPVVLALGKDTFHRQVDLAEAAAYDLTREVMAVNAGMPDAQEGMSAFRRRRAPVWSE